MICFYYDKYLQITIAKMSTYIADQATIFCVTRMLIKVADC
jgi:hypothetical protein